MDINDLENIAFRFGSKGIKIIFSKQRILRQFLTSFLKKDLAFQHFHNAI